MDFADFLHILNLSAPSDIQFSGKVMPDKTSRLGGASDKGERDENESRFMD
jgi:hypothetical protein